MNLNYRKLHLSRNNRGISAQEMQTGANFRLWVHWRFGEGYIYGQDVQRSGSPGRVQTVSWLTWGWGEILSRCSLVRKQVSIFCKSGIYEKAVSQFLSFKFLKAHMWDSVFPVFCFHFRWKFALFFSFIVTLIAHCIN